MIDPPVSVLLLTLNEEADLPKCLAALGWCRDVVVLDSCSTDRTCEIARAAGARVFVRRFDGFASQRNHALANIEFAHTWILHLDADEIVTDELVDSLRRVLTSGEYDAYRLPSKTMFEGRWMRRSGMYPAYQVRLTRNGAFRFRQVGHGQKEDVPVSRVGTLDVPYLHFPFSKGLEDWYAKHNRYSTQEALLARETEGDLRFAWDALFASDSYQRRQALRRLSQRLPLRPLARFLYMYILRGGVLEGRSGLEYCLLLACYEFMISSKVRALGQSRTPRDAP